MADTFDEAECLATDPFAGDFGDPGDRTLSDKIVRAAKVHSGACHDCAGDIAKGEAWEARVAIGYERRKAGGKADVR